MNRFWKYAWVTLAFSCLMALPALAQSEQEGFHEGDVYAVDRGPTPVMAPHGDDTQATSSAPLTPYYITIQVGDDVYVYEDDVETGQEIPFEAGQSPQVRIIGDAIQVKQITGEIDSYPLVSAGTASADGDE
jgi:hypothetical protein